MLKASGELVKKLKKQKRENDFLLFLDNQKIINDAISHGAKPLLALAVDEALLPNIECEKYLTTMSVIEDLAEVKSPRGVVVMLEYTQNVVLCPKKDFLVLDKLQDPGNVGTLIRTALASGMECVFLLDSVKPTNAKLVRSSAGAIFNIPTISMTEQDFIKFAKENSLTLAKTDMKGEDIFKFQPLKNIGIVIGNEGNGVSKEISQICNVALTIPMHPGIESLNAAVSGSIIMFQIASKRK